MELSSLKTFLDSRVPPVRLIAVAGDERLGEEWWFVHTDGLYHSTDGGGTVARVLDERGGAAR